MQYLREIIRTDPHLPLKSGKLWVAKGDGEARPTFLAFGPNEKRTLLFGIYVVAILLWVGLPA